MADLLSSRLDEMNRIMDRFFGRPVSSGAREGFWHPPADIHRTPESVIVRLDIPGIDPKKVEISIEENTLTVRGNRPTCAEAAQEEQCWYNETPRGDFHRIIDLPEYVDRDSTSATYVNGVLTITMPKREAAKPRLVEIKTE